MVVFFKHSCMIFIWFGGVLGKLIVILDKGVIFIGCVINCCYYCLFMAEFVLLESYTLVMVAMKIMASFWRFEFNVDSVGK